MCARVLMCAVCTGDNAQLSCSYKRIASVGRIKTPRSPSRNTFESAEDSDEEEPDFGNGDLIPFYPGNMDSSNNYVRIYLLIFFSISTVFILY